VNARLGTTALCPPLHDVHQEAYPPSIAAARHRVGALKLTDHLHASCRRIRSLVASKPCW
jgi:hypothetical protein